MSSAPKGGMDAFHRDGTYQPGMFQDVAQDAWYAEGVAAAYELGLMKGASKGTFSPEGDVTAAEAIAMAARLHQHYTAGKDDLIQGSPWYQVYVDYARSNGILSGDEFLNGYGENITRGQMAHLFASALPQEALTAINVVESLPDVNSSTAYSSDIFLLYRAGVLTGNDANGTFTPDAPITRSQVAAIVARMALPPLRKGANAIQPLGLTRGLLDIQGIGEVEPYGNYWLPPDNKITVDLAEAPGLAYSLNFSEKTQFGKLPAGFDPVALLEWGKAPGLYVDILHEHGFTGKGAVIAYIDQAMSNHEQYSTASIHYINNSGKKETMHGPTVLSMLAGKDIGTAPDAEIYYYSTQSGDLSQLSEAQCLYEIIEQNKKLPEGKKITMVGFSDNIDPREPYAQEFREAAAACEEAGIMVWFCGEYSTSVFLPYSDKNNPQNIVSQHIYNPNPPLVHVPSSGRTGAATMGGVPYIYWGESGGLSWTMPYVLGLYAIAIEIDPTLTQEQLRQLIVSTAYDNGGMSLVNPVGFISAVLDQVGRSKEADALRQEVVDRTRYLYAVMDTAAMTQEDLKAVGNYLAAITDASVLVADASGFADAKSLYAVLKADAAQREGTVVGVQLFGTPDMLPAFQVDYKVLMSNGEIDDAGTFLTDLFYGNFNNDPERIASGYNIMEHFEQGWNVDLIPQWPVARLPLSKGEFAAFFAKYKGFVANTGLERLDLVNFSNPIFRQTRHTDEMGTFLKRMDQEFHLLDIPYRLYGNLDGQYPVNARVLGGFTRENLSKENHAGPMELLINSHGQQNNIDQCFYVNDQEKRVSFLNMDTINGTLGSNPYYLDCWTCLNGHSMADNLTTAALKGQCVGVFSATGIISNNGVNCNASLAKMEQSNFYYFYYHYLKALHEGQTRSMAFFAAQCAYGEALLKDSANGIRDGEGNYQFNLYNLLTYHNFGVLEPSAAWSIFDAAGYITQAGQSVPKQTHQTGDHPASAIQLTNGIPVEQSRTVVTNMNNRLKEGTVKVHSCTVQLLDNGYVRYTLDYTAPKNLFISVFSPPNGDLFMQIDNSGTTGNRDTLIFDLTVEDASATEITINFYYKDNGRCFVFLPSYTP